MASGSRPVSRSVWRSASTIEPRQGCEVRPDMASMAASTASTPASTAASTLAPAMPEVSWVWKWIGRPTSSLSALIRTRAAAGCSRPAMSLTPRMWQPARLELLGQADIVGQRVLGPVGVEDVAGVADGTLGELARLAHGVDRDPHVLDPVQAVEDAEQVHAGVGRLLDEVADDVVGVVGVADAVGAAQQHLQEQVGDPLAQQRQPLPRILVEEPHGDVEGGAAPALEREELRQAAGVGVGAGDQVVGAHARRQQRLVRVAHGRVGDQHPRLLAHPARRRPPGPSRSSSGLVPAARVERDRELRRLGRARIGARAGAAGHLGMAVDRHVGDVGQELGRPVAPLARAGTARASRR